MPGDQLLDSALPRMTGPSTEVAELLRMAEDLRDRLDGLQRRISLYRMTELLVVLMVLGFGVVAAANWSASTVAAAGIVATFGCAGVYVLLGEGGLLRTLARRRDEEARALSQIVAILRETEAALAEQQDWSTLDRAQFRIRLSRFGI